jgi:hypothetical protein
VFGIILKIGVLVILIMFAVEMELSGESKFVYAME